MSRDVVPAGMVSLNVSLFNACVTLCVLGDLLTIWHPPPFQRTDRGIDSIFICLQSRGWPAAITQHSSDAPGPAARTCWHWGLEPGGHGLVTLDTTQFGSRWAVGTHLYFYWTGWHMQAGFFFFPAVKSITISALAPVCTQLTCQKVSDELEPAELCISHQILVLRVLQLDSLYHWITAWIFSFISFTNHNTWVVSSSLLGSGLRSTLLFSHRCQLALIFSDFLLWGQIEVSDLEVKDSVFC